MFKIHRLNDNPLPVSPGISTPFAPLIRVIRPCAAAWVVSNRRDVNLVRIMIDEKEMRARKQNPHFPGIQEKQSNSRFKVSHLY